MRNPIGRIFEWLLRLLLPAPGHHRAAETSPLTHCVSTPATDSPRVLDPYVWPAIHGEDVRLVRPYVVAHERGMRPSPANATPWTAVAR
ncbi:hypothetical protein ACFY7Z_22445 [Streptomyces sp. NPDC012623]|uniref:hypothetical protein n=1 Tax=unclassified Streptomyces TaxID=2593676 RepID=UPI0036753E19